jgi:hypothetical protein
MKETKPEVIKEVYEKPIFTKEGHLKDITAGLQSSGTKED